MDILRLFFECDEFCREFDSYLSTKQLSDGKRHRHRDSTLSISEVMTIVILFQLSGFRNFKTYYTQHVCRHLRSEFPHLVSYQPMVELETITALPLTAFLLTRFGHCTGISFIDSTSIKVCHNLRIRSNKVFCNLAKRGKTSTGSLLRLQGPSGDQRLRRIALSHDHSRQRR
jgi:Transposase DDE domain